MFIGMILLAILGVTLAIYAVTSYSDSILIPITFMIGFIFTLVGFIGALSIASQHSVESANREYSRQCQAVGGHVAQDVCVDVNGKLLYNQR